MTPGTETTSRLVMRGVTRRFGATQALRGVDLDVRGGEVLGLVGENGAGKSTLMKVLSGAVRPDAGQMWLDASPYAPAGPIQARGAGVAMIYQELSLAPHLSVEQNILLGIEPTLGPFVRHRAAAEIARKALAAIDADLPLSLPVRRLSPAQQQLVEIARAVAIDCRVLVLDEPTSSLARREIDRLFALVRRLRGKGMAIVYISHFLEEISAACDRYTVLRDGRSVGGGAVADAQHDRIVSLMVGRDVDELYPRQERTPGEPILSLDDVAGSHRPVSATLELRRGEVLGIAGLIGAGRTELLRAIFGLDPIRSGRIRVAGFSGGATPAARWAQGAGFVSENRKAEGLATGLSIADNLTLPRLGGLGPARLVLPSRQASAARRWTERLSIRCASPMQRVGALSGGNQQKVALARLLHADVDLLLLDEPTRGIDVGSKAEIYRLIDELARGARATGRPHSDAGDPCPDLSTTDARPMLGSCGHGSPASECGRPVARARAVLIVSSYLPELLGVCDRIAVMHRGRLGPARPVQQWSEQSLMMAATGAAGGE